MVYLAILYNAGVRQGNPLSPLLFVLATDLLQLVVNKAMNLGLISTPLQNSNEIDFSIVQYADDNPNHEGISKGDFQS